MRERNEEERKCLLRAVVVVTRGARERVTSEE